MCPANYINWGWSSLQPKCKSYNHHYVSILEEVWYRKWGETAFAPCYGVFTGFISYCICRCQCGADKEWHYTDEHAVDLDHPPQEQWDCRTHTESFPGTSYGTICFTGFGKEASKSAPVSIPSNQVHWTKSQTISNRSKEMLRFTNVRKSFFTSKLFREFRDKKVANSVDWTLVWLSRQWAWLRRGYWCYRRLIDWLIDWKSKWTLPLLTFTKVYTSGGSRNWHGTHLHTDDRLLASTTT